MTSRRGAFRAAIRLSAWLLLTAWLTGCDGPTSPRLPPPQCRSLTELECTLSAQCTLVLAGDTLGDYRCRAARDRCELGFIQRTGTADSCEEKAGCRFQPGQCYCPPDLVCVCGGGPPPQCQPDTV